MAIKIGHGCRAIVALFDSDIVDLIDWTAETFLLVDIEIFGMEALDALSTIEEQS